MRVANVEVQRRLNVTKNDVHDVQTVMRRKLGLFGHFCRMDNSRKIKGVMTGMMEGTERKERPCREWLEAIEDWCQTYVYSATQIVHEGRAWTNMVTNAMDTYGLSAPG